MFNNMTSHGETDTILSLTTLEEIGTAHFHLLTEALLIFHPFFFQTDFKFDENATALRDMREYYLETVNKIKEDVFKHITKTKENAASNLR